jgi:hypothetical protein
MTKGGGAAKSGGAAKGGGAAKDGGGARGTRAGRAAQERARQVLEEQRRQRVRRQQLVAAAIGIGLVAVVAIIMVTVKLTGGDGTPATVPTGQAAADVVHTATNIPAELLDRVGRGKVDAPPKAITGPQPLTADGKPLVLYVGAEYCPFCASQRWAVVVALSRFGTFSNLGLTGRPATTSTPTPRP